MPSLMPLPVFQAFDFNGDPLEGGKLYTYEAGTSTPKATFVDASGVTANTNPIILDAAGQAIVYLVGNYKLVLTDADDVLQSPYPIDNVREIPGAAASVTEWNASGLVPSYVNATTFSVAGDQRTLLHVGRRVKLTQSGSTRYGTIATSVYSSVTTVTVTDAGALDATLNSVEVGFVSSDNSSIATAYSATLLRELDQAAWQTALDVYAKAAVDAAIAAVAATANAAWTTGDYKLTSKSIADTGWVILNDGTLGSATSGGTMRANADCQALFLLWYAQYPNAVVSGGRGASAAADWAANKTIEAPKVLGRAWGIAGAGAGLTSRVMGDVVGAETHTLTAAEMQHYHSISYTGGLNFGANNLISDSVTNGVTLNSPSAHNNMQPTIFGSRIMVKL